MKIHHIGVAVRSIEKAVQKYKILGYQVETNIVWDEKRNINILFMINGEERIELIESADIKKESPVKAFLNGTRKNIMYHICFETDNILNQIEKLRKQGFIVIDKPAIAPACEKKMVGFLFSHETGIIELIEARGN